MFGVHQEVGAESMASKQKQTTSQLVTPRPFLEILLGGTIREFLGWLIFAAILTVLASGIVVWSASNVTSYKHPTYSTSLASFDSMRGLQAWKLKRIRRALELFRRERGQYPDSLKQLAMSGWLHEKELKDVPGCRPLFRLSSPQEYELLCTVP